MTRVVIGISCRPELRDQVDARAKSLGMTRSEFVSQLLRRELLSTRPDEPMQILAQQAAVHGGQITNVGSKVVQGHGRKKEGGRG